MIRFDHSPGSVVCVCSCGWRDVFTATVVALRVAALHEEGHNQQAARELRKRHARVAAANARKSPR